MAHTNNKEVKGGVEAIIEYVIKSRDDLGVYNYVIRETLTKMLHQELQKARESERELVIAEINKKYWLNPKRSKSDVAKDNAWNDLGNTLRNGV